MAVNIKNNEVENLLNELALLTGESKTETVRQALLERRRRLTAPTNVRQPKIRLLTFLEEEVWPQIPAEQLGVRLTKAEEEAILGYGENGV
jgi:antitoxin VapB